MIGRKRTLIFSLSKYFKFFDFRFFFRFFEAIKKNCRNPAALAALGEGDEAALAALGEDDDDEAEAEKI